MSTTLRQPKSAKPAKRNRTEWDELIRQREEKNEARKQLDRQSAAIAKEVGELDEQLAAFLESETAGAQEQQLTLKSFILSFVWTKPSAMAMAFKALGKLSPVEKDELKASIPDKKKIDIQWRDARPSSPAAAAA